MNLRAAFAAVLFTFAAVGAGIAYAAQEEACCCCEGRADCECCDHGEGRHEGH